MQIAMQKRQQLSAVGTQGFFTILTTYHSNLWKWMHDECRNFIQKHTLLSRCSLLKVNIANPDSNLVVLNSAYEYWQPTWAFNDDLIVETNKAEIKWPQQLLRLSWFKPKKALKGKSMAIQIQNFRIVVADSRGRMFSAFISYKRCCIGLENRNWPQIQLLVAEKIKKHCAHVGAWE